jgi:hypothetical protein
VLAAATAVFLAASLILEAAFRQVTLGRWFAVAGLVFLVLAILAPSWPRRHSRHDRRQPLSEPHFGRTRHGLAVHARVADHHPAGTRYERFNRSVAVVITRNVGTMTCFWLFTVLALLSLPATLKLAGVIKSAWVLPAFFLTFGFIYLIQWVAQNYIQLVLLPALMVGQNLQNEASDARSAKQFEDVEALRSDVTVALDRLDDKTEGGIKAVLDAVGVLAAQVAGPKAAPVKRLATRAERDDRA